jgi:hypothetical protein
MKISKISAIVSPNTPLDISCPFCKDTGFDLAGLKSHLLKGDCVVFNNTANFERLMREPDVFDVERDEAGFEREEKE